MEHKAPETVGWYIELTKWLIGIAAAVLVFGFDKLHLSELGPVSTVAFWVCAGLLALSIGSGIVCCMLFLGYANRKETGQRAAGETDAHVAGYRDNGTRLYKLCGATLWAGIALFGLVWAVSQIEAPNAESKAAPVILPLPDQAGALIIQPGAAGSGPAVLARNKANQYSWQLVKIPAASQSQSENPPADSRVAPTPSAPAAGSHP